jgi:hypothetical protein
MRFRKLRIAWSVGCGVVAVFLIGAWLFSYRYSMAIEINSPTELSRVSVDFGQIRVVKWKGSFVGGPEWRFEPYYQRTPKQDLASFLLPGFQVRPNLAIPLWLLMLPFAGMATAPWISWRFSLRTLLVITTLAAILLGLIAWTLHG